MSKKKGKGPSMPDWDNPDLVQNISMMELLTITVDLKDNDGYYMLLDLHGNEKHKTPHWYLVAKDTKKRLGVIDIFSRVEKEHDADKKTVTYFCKWEKGHRPCVAPETRAEAEKLTIDYAETILDYFENGIPDFLDPY